MIDRRSGVAALNIRRETIDCNTRAVFHDRILTVRVDVADARLRCDQRRLPVAPG
jgi:hypothetical protein